MRILAGISGGADSVCLLLVLSEYRKIVPFHLTAVHVEHGIRGGKPGGCCVYRQALRPPRSGFCAGTNGCAGACKAAADFAGGDSEVGALPDFEKVRRERGAERIAVAHNRNDQAETVLWNLVRGSGLKGLGGMRPVRDRIIRPLLFTEREQIEQIVLSAGLTWRTDRTNLEQEYTRNRIRLSVLPQMSVN